MRFRLSEFRQLVSEAVRKAYEILGVDQSATPEDIKKAYRAKAIALHPDRNPGKDTGPDMVKLNVAYGLLSDPEKRRRYDSIGDKTLGDAGGFGYAPPPGPRPQPRPQSTWSPPPRPKPQPGPTPGPRTGSTAGTATKRYFTYVGGTSKKFWECERKGNSVTVRFGRIGTPGQTKTHNFPDEYAAIKFARNKISEKLDKGYREQTPPSASSAGPSPRSAASPPPPPPPPKAQSPNTPPPAPKQARPASKSTYKVYGRKGKAPAHTRYQGKVYGAPADTKFKQGMQATVMLGSDGRLSVHDPATGHTQHWYEESLQRLVDDLILDGMFGYHEGE